MTFRDPDAIQPAMEHYPDADGRPRRPVQHPNGSPLAVPRKVAPMGETPRERIRRAVEAAQEHKRPPSKRERRRGKQQERRQERVVRDVHPLTLAGKPVILSDATRRIGGICAAAVVHDGRIVASEVFEARSSNVAEMRGVALAARYAAENHIDEALFLCDNGGVVECVKRRSYSIARAVDADWLRLIAHRSDWRIEQVPRKMVREAHRAAALALA